MEKKSEKKLSRREMLKIGGLGAAAFATTKVADRISAAETTVTGRRLAMVIDLRRCIGCQACSVSCKAEFDVPLGVWRSWVKEANKGIYPNVTRVFLPRLCNHCDHAPCVKACPVKASYQADDGSVQIREERCIGCKLCMSACPYDARFIHPVKNIANKCTFCIHRVEAGVVPACVNTCQAEARIFGDLNDPNSEVSKLINTRNVQVLKPEFGTEPHVFYISADINLMGRIEEVT